MDKYPRTHLGILLMMTALSLPVSAQTRNTATAVLHIKVNIVPALISAPPPVEPKIPPMGPVSYSIPTARSGQEITEETHPLLIQNAASTARVDGAVLKTVTIVLH